MNCIEIYQGDDTDFGGACLARMIITKPQAFITTKLEFRLGTIFKTFDLKDVVWEEIEEHPEYVKAVITLNLDREETKQLCTYQTGKVALYDKDDNKRTAKGFLPVKVKKGVV